MRKIWACVILLGTLLSCGKDDVVLTDVDTAIETWLSDRSITATRDDSGLYYFPTSSNALGAAITASSVVSIYYTLSDLEGNVIASHQRSDGDSLTLKQGVSAVYPIGLDLGLRFMREGEQFSIIVPPSLGYEDLSSGAISTAAISLFEVEVVSVQSESAIFAQEQIDIDNYITTENLNDTVTNPYNRVVRYASGVATKRVSKGFGPIPINGEEVILDYTAQFLDKTIFDSKTNFSFVFGSSEPRLLIPGFEFGVSLMQPVETSTIIIPSSQGYLESALVIPAFITDALIEDAIVPAYVASVPPYSTLVFTVTRFD